MKLLLVDGDESLLCIHKPFLLEKGCLVDTAKTAAKAVTLISEDHYDGILLEVTLENVSGFELCSQIKKMSGVPVIFLSNVSDEEIQARGFLSGADDYILKSCGLDLFWLKLKTRVALYKKEGQKTVLDFGPLQIDFKKRKATLGSKEISLTKVEFDILALMACGAQDRIWTLSDIYAEVWGQESLDHLQTVQVHISRLRIKMEKAFPAHYFLETVWGKGYQFVPVSAN